MKPWTAEELKSKVECYRFDHTINKHPYVIDRCSRTDWDGHDISSSDDDLTWCIISCLTGDYFIQHLEVSEILIILNYLGFTRE
jgi:hypothetical protein